MDRLENGLRAQAEDSLGMAMVYTLAGYLQESLAELVRERKERVAKAEAEAYRLAEEVSSEGRGGRLPPELGVAERWQTPGGAASDSRYPRERAATRYQVADALLCSSCRQRRRSMRE